jgi:hypothetical protein
MPPDPPVLNFNLNDEARGVGHNRGGQRAFF